MGKLRFGIIGCGDIACRAFVPALKRSDVAELVAVASRSAEKSKELAYRFDCKAVDGYEALCRRQDIDAVYIATPIGVHRKWSLEAAQAGKHVLCEKTLAIDYNETKEILETCANHDVALLEGFAYQFHPQHSLLRKMILEGRLGDAVLFQAWYGFPPIKSAHRYDPALGGGSLLDAGTYTIHAARRFFGREPVRVEACFDFRDGPVEIHGSMLLDFGNGQNAHLAFGFDNMYRNAYSVWGTNGLVTLTRAFAIPPTFAPTVILERQSYREEHVLAPYNQFLGEIEAFSAGINDPEKRRFWRQDALGQAEVVKAVRESARKSS